MGAEKMWARKTPSLSACGSRALLPAHPSRHLLLAKQLVSTVSHLWRAGAWGENKRVLGIIGIS